MKYNHSKWDMVKLSKKQIYVIIDGNGIKDNNLINELLQLGT